MYSSELIRDTAVTAAVLAVAANAWFGWAQEYPPPRWRPLLIAAWIVTLPLVVTAVGLVWANWDEPSALDTEAARSWFGVVVALEVTLSAVGAYVLSRVGLSRWTSPWVCLVVGLHFVPLAVLFEAPGLHLLGALLIGVSGAAMLSADRRRLHPSALTGAGAGLVLLLFATIAVWSVRAGAG